MVTAWQVPLDPMKDASLTDARMAEQMRWGYRIFVNTPHEAPRLTGGKVSCSNCHLNAGQRERALPLVGVAGMFPEYNNRAARLFSLPDRIVDCFLRSENAHRRGPRQPRNDVVEGSARGGGRTSPGSRGYAVGENPSWRGRNTIAADALVPSTSSTPAGRGDLHGALHVVPWADGQGVRSATRRRDRCGAPDSWNDGAGAARVYTLAGIIRYSMPYLDPGSLTDEEAQQVAAFITSQPRPAFPVQRARLCGRESAGRRGLLRGER